LGPVSAGIYALLNVAALTALAPGGVHNVVPQNTAYPFCLFEVSVPEQRGGFGTWPGHGDVPEVELRIHAFSDLQNVTECQTILAKAIELLFTTPLSVTGYTVASALPLPDSQLVNLGDQVISGVVVHEECVIVRLVLQENSGTVSWMQSGWAQG
jgi:hypothetical protein